MGMFDDLTCDMPIPGKTKPKELSFQTKDFGCYLDQYQIRSDGTLWMKEREDDKEKQVMHHGWLSFYTFESEKSDGDGNWFEYKAKFTDGICQEIKLVQISITHFGKRESTILERDNTP